MQIPREKLEKRSRGSDLRRFRLDRLATGANFNVAEEMYDVVSSSSRKERSLVTVKGEGRSGNWRASTDETFE